jgi:1-acyl-sn-glycerol-3-phosphate acyltransferase
MKFFTTALKVPFTIYVYLATYLAMILGAILAVPIKLFFGQHAAHKYCFRPFLGGCIPITFSTAKVTYHPEFDPERRGVFILNHVSILDGAAGCWVLPHAFCGLFNSWNFWIPGYGWIMTLSKGIGVPAGKSGAGRIQAINEQAIQRAKERISILALPEGHRTRDGKIGPFRRGSFFMAREAGYPVIPYCVRGMFEIESKRSWLFTPGHLEVYLGKPIETAGLSDDEIAELMNRMRQIHIAWVERGEILEYEEAKAA